MATTQHRRQRLSLLGAAALAVVSFIGFANVYNYSNPDSFLGLALAGQGSGTGHVMLAYGVDGAGVVVTAILVCLHPDRDASVAHPAKYMSSHDADELICVRIGITTWNMFSLDGIIRWSAGSYPHHGLASGFLTCPAANPVVCQFNLPPAPCHVCSGAPKPVPSIRCRLPCVYEVVACHCWSSCQRPDQHHQHHLAHVHRHHYLEGCSWHSRSSVYDLCTGATRGVIT